MNLGTLTAKIDRGAALVDALFEEHIWLSHRLADGGSTKAGTTAAKHSRSAVLSPAQESGWQSSSACLWEG